VAGPGEVLGDCIPLTEIDSMMKDASQKY